MPQDAKAYNAVKHRLTPLISEGMDVSPMRVGTREHGGVWSQTHVMVRLADLERLFSELRRLRGENREITEATKGRGGRLKPL